MINNSLQGTLIDIEYAHTLRICLIEQPNPIPIEGYDGHRSDSDLHFYMTPLELQIGDHRELIEFNVAKIAHYPIILGASWVCTHDVITSLTRNKVMFPSEFCTTDCLLTSNSVTALARHPRLEGLDEGFAAGIAGI
jgi:hypothetical protein